MRFRSLVAAWVVSAGLAAGAQSTPPTGIAATSWQNFMSAVSRGHMQLLPDTDPRCRRVDSIGQRVALPCHRPVRWMFFVVKVNEPNAACTGEGVIFVTTGLLDLNLDDDELAGVLSHEVAHGARQHLDDDRLEKARLARAYSDYNAEVARIRSNNRGSAGGQDAFQVSQINAARGQLNDQIARTNSYNAQKSAFSHTHESEADMLGLRYAAEAGYKPDGLRRALEKLEAHSFLQYGQKALLGSKTHPPLPARIERLRQLQERSGL